MEIIFSVFFIGIIELINKKNDFNEIFRYWRCIVN